VKGIGIPDLQNDPVKKVSSVTNGSPRINGDCCTRENLSEARKSHFRRMASLDLAFCAAKNQVSNDKQSNLSDKIGFTVMLKSMGRNCIGSLGCPLEESGLRKRNE